MAELEALDAAIEANAEAAAALEEALAAGLEPEVIEAITADLREATAALEVAAAAFAALEAPPAPPVEIPEAFRSPQPAPPPPLPVASGRDGVVLMVRDPESVFTYWELTPEGVGWARSGLEGEGALVLRVYVQPDDAAEPEVQDFEIEDWLGSRTVEIGRPGARVVTAVGFRAGGTFVHVARAAAVRLARRGAGGGAIRFSRLGQRGAVKATPERIDALPEDFRLRPRVGTLIASAGDARVAREGIDSQGLRAFALQQAVPVGAADQVSDLHRVVGSNHLIGQERRS